MLFQTLCSPSTDPRLIQRHTRAPSPSSDLVVSPYLQGGCTPSQLTIQRPAHSQRPHNESHHLSPSPRLRHAPHPTRPWSAFICIWCSFQIQNVLLKMHINTLLKPHSIVYKSRRWLPVIIQTLTAEAKQGFTLCCSLIEKVYKEDNEIQYIT